MIDPHVGPPMRGKGKAALVHVADARIVWPRLVQDDPVGAARLDDIADGLHRVLVGEEWHDDQMIGRPLQRPRDGIEELRRVVHHIRLGRQDQRDHVGLARPQAHARAVRAIAQPFRRLAHAALRVLADIGRILQRATDRRHGKTRGRRDGLQRRAFVGGQQHGAIDMRICHFR